MKIAINAGHTLTGPGSGAVGFLNESNENRRVYNELVPILERAGHTVVNCNVDKASTQAEYLAKTVQIANNSNPDMFISIHFNASVNHNAGGTAVYVYGGRKYDEAVKCCANIAALGFKNRGIWDGSNLYVLRHTKARAMLIETCFVDFESDAVRYNQVGPKLIAEAIAKAVIGEIKPEVTEGWVKDDKGWWYRLSDGSYPKSEWKEVNGLSYYFKEDGYIAMGWYEYNGNWYYFDPVVGNMVTGWVMDKGKWYYLDCTGVMVKDGIKSIGNESFLFDKDGAMVETDDVHFYTNERGALCRFVPSEPETSNAPVSFEE